MDEYFCPHCGAILNDQPGFDPNNGTWTCTECGTRLMGDDIYEGDIFEGVAWCCDKCGALLNRQIGFTDAYGSWTCTECGYENGTTESDIISEDPEFECPQCGVSLDFQPGFNKYDDNWKCTACGSHLHHSYSSDEYTVMEFICPNCDAPLDIQSCFSRYDDDWKCTECGAHLHHEYSGDQYSIVDSKYKCPNCGAVLDDQLYFDDYKDDWKCTECGSFLHRNYSEEEYAVMEFICPNCDAPLDIQSGFNKYDDNWQCTECGSHLHHEYCDDEYEEIDENDIEDDEDDENNTSYGNAGPKYSDSSAAVSYQTTQNPGTIDGSRSSNLGDPSKIVTSLKTKKRNWKLRIIGTIVLIIAIGIGVGYYEMKLLVTVGHSASELIGKEYEDVVTIFEDAGFTNIVTKEIADLPLNKSSYENHVERVKIGLLEDFSSSSRYPSNFTVIIEYHSLEKYNVPMSSKEAIGENYQDIIKSFNEAGFERISLEVKYDIITGWLTSDGEVKSVVINGNKNFSVGEEYRADAEIVITYHTYFSNKH